MRDLFAGWRFALQRLRAGWRFMLVAAVGVAVAATLLAAAPIYAQTMSDLGLRFRLERGLDEPKDQVLSAQIIRMAIGDPGDLARREALAEVTAARIGDLGPEIHIEERSPRFDLSFVGFEDEAPEEPVVPPSDATEALRQPWGAYLIWPSGFEEHVDVAEGRLPSAEATELEVVLPDGFQRHAAIGDVVLLEGARFDDCQAILGSDDPSIAADEVQCRPTAFAAPTIRATIVGFVAPHDEGDQRWQFLQLGLDIDLGNWEVPEAPIRPRIPPIDPVDGPDAQTGLALRGLGSMPLLTTEHHFFGVLGAQAPALEAQHRTGIVPDLDAIRLGEVSRTIDDIEAWSTDIGDRLDLLGLRQTELAEELETFRNAQTFSQVPLLLILLQVVGIVLFYVVLVMNMLLERQSEEIGVYVGRGASTTQVVGLSVVEGLVLAVPATLLAPILAQVAVRALGFTSTFEPITGGEALPAALTPDAFVLAAAGASLSLVAMLLPSFMAARRGIVDVKRDQARPAGRGLIQRYYLDVAVVVLAGLLLWQLDQRGTVFDPDAVGGWSTDPLLLLSPLVFTLAVAAILLRFYPPLLRLAVRILMVLKGTAVALGLRRAGRAPAAYARLMLLVVMAISVGTFAASYGPTVDRSFSERVRYETGVPYRGTVADASTRLRPEELEAVRALEGVRDATLVHRGRIEAPNGSQVALLAIDVERAREMLWFRDDFAAAGEIEALLGRLESAVPAGGGLVLPEGAERVQFSVMTEGPLAGESRASIRTIFRGADGSYLDDFVSTAAGVGWITVEAEVPSRLERPVALVSMVLTDQQTSRLRVDGALVFDDFVAIGPGQTRTILDDFEGEFRWTVYPAQGREEPFEQVEDVSRTGSMAARWTWEPAVGSGRRVLALNDPVVPVAALMNDVALGVLGAGAGGIAIARFDDVLVPLSVRGRVDLFPTIEPDQGIVVVNYEHLRSLSGTVDFDDPLLQNELWVDFEPETTIEQQEAIAAQLEVPRESPLAVQFRTGSVLSRQLEEVRSDPTIQASGSGILSVAFVAVLALSTLGFVVTLVLSARSRTVEFAVLRTVGTSSRQIFRAMLLEWGTVLVIGTTIGVLLGRQVARIMLSFLEVTELGTPVLPPFTLETDWRALAVGIGVLCGLVLLTLASSWAATARRTDPSELRITQ